MKSWILITDFDNTMSEKDFYHIMIDDYIGKTGQSYYEAYRKTNKIGVEFLNKIFRWQSLSQEDHDMMLSKVVLDPDTKKLVDYVSGYNGDFLILSAGFDYYIEATLSQIGLENILLITNPGVFEAGHFRIIPDVRSPYYSEVYGVDKGAVVKAYKEKYDIVVFVGDSEPDYHGAIHADLIFAKEQLSELLIKVGKVHYPIKDYGEIFPILNRFLQLKGVKKQGLSES